MKSAFVTSAFAALSAFTPALAATYTRSDSIVGTGFYDAFDWENIADPTNGGVNYVDQATSKSQNLTYTTSDTFLMRVDDLNTISASGAGRNSVRIKSKKTYTTHVAVFNVRHMPQGCGTWPAIWETKESGWPAGGEVDILEGVNDQGPNAATLHTSAGCTMPASRDESGTPTQSDCNTAVNGNAGCGVKFPSATSYGPSMNSAGGGWYAMERTSTFVKVWFWARNDGSVPSDVKSGTQQVNTDAWGQPAAFFPNTSCNINQFFSDHNIIINIALCGDWAGSVFASDGCPGNCVDYVNSNPSAFTNAYFNFASINVYQ